jgi:capsular exopolysaccharide synthesis family protein
MENSQDSRLHFLDYWRVIRVRLGLVILVFLLVVIAAGVATYFLPRKYNSFATIEVEPEMTPVRIFDNQTGSQHEVNEPKFTQTQFQIIMRKGVLYPVIDRLDLQRRWGSNSEPLPKEVANRRLLGMLSLQEVRNTNLIQIDVYSTDPQEAALLANTIANVYMEQRIAEQQSLVSKGLDQMLDDVKKQEEAVSQAYMEASRLRTESNIVDPNPDSLDNSGRVEDSSVMSNQEKVNEAKSQVATLQSRVAELDRLKSEDLMRAAGQLNLNDPIIEQKLPVYQSAQADKARMLNSGLGVNHPDVKAAQAQIDTIEGQLRKQIDSIRKGLATQLAIAEDSLKAIESNLTNSQTEQQTKKTASARYQDAKHKYVEERKLLEAAKSRLSSESMERTMPRNAAVVRDLAEPALFPSKPNVSLNMALGVAAGLVLGISLAFFVEYLDTSVKTMDDVEKYVALPVLAVIPQGIKMLPNAGDDTADAEAYRILKTNVDFNRKKLNASTLSIVSGGAQEGKSTTACNLATSWAKSGLRILVVDADLRRPSQHRLFGVENRLGLGNYLKGEATLDEVIHPTSVSNLSLTPAGSAATDVVSLLHSETMEHLVEVAKERFDVVIFDSPPILGVSDASIIASLVDGSIVVVQHRRFPRSMLLRVKKAIQNVGGEILGVVLNNVNIRHDRHYEYYTSYTHYYTKPKNGRKQPVKVAANVEGEKTDDEY